MAPRATLPFLLGLLLLAPHAAAQAGPMEMRVAVEPFPAAVAPLKGIQETKVVVDAPCAVPGTDPTRARLDLWLTDAPAWSTVVLSPTTFELDPMACQGGRLVREATLSATASDQAPAFKPAAFKVHAAWVGATPNLTAEDDVEVSASYFSVLDVQLAQAIQTVKPGGRATFPVKVTNLGNAETTVVFELESAPEGLSPQVPPPVVLQSKQAGGSAITAEVPLEIDAPAGGGFVNQAGSVTYRVRAHHAADESLAGDATTLSLLVTVKGFDAPSPGPLPVLALAAVAALVVARRARAP